MKKTLTAVAAIVLASTAHTAFAEITIGVAGPMTGQYASFGQQMKAGAEQAVAAVEDDDALRVAVGVGEVGLDAVGQLAGQARVEDAELGRRPLADLVARP